MNNVSMTGRLVRDIELKHTGKDIAFANFTLVVNNPYKKCAYFFKCVAWGKTAEIASKYVSKGDPMGVVGSLEINEWTNKEGEKQSSPQINVATVDLLGSPKGKGNTSDSEESPPPDENDKDSGFDKEDDDMPF